MNKTIKLKSKTKIDQAGIKLLEDEIKKISDEVSEVQIQKSYSFGLGVTETIISITISFATSIAANMAYDYGKYVVKSLMDRGIESEVIDEENQSDENN